MKIDIDSPRLQTSAATFTEALAAMLARLHERDTALDTAHIERLLICDDPAQALAALGRPCASDAAPALQRVDATLVLAASALESALAGEAHALMHLVHALHRECWRAQLEQPAPAQGGIDALAEQFDPIVHLMLLEFDTNRRCAWSLPADSDLLLPHLMALLQALPAACQRAIAAYQLDGRLDELVGLSLGRLTHLMQTAAFSMGYLNGLGRRLAQVSTDLQAALDDSLLARAWPRIAALLAGASASQGEARALQSAMLRAQVLDVLGTMGLAPRLDDQGQLWMDVAAASPKATAAAVASLGPLH